MIVLLSCIISNLFCFFFFFNDTATTEIYTLSLHDALPISRATWVPFSWFTPAKHTRARSEEHTSELQSRRDLVCRLLLEKKKKEIYTATPNHRKKVYTSSTLTPNKT